MDPHEKALLKEFGLDSDDDVFGAEFDEGDAFKVQDHIDEYLADTEVNAMDDFENLCDSVGD